MQIEFGKNSVTFRGLAHFCLQQCLCCGQAFRWRQQEDGFAGVALGRAVTARQTGDALTLAGVDACAAADFAAYFDLARDYGAIKKSYAHDPFLRAGMEYAGGMRVLRQPPFETLISFIISANNNVARISRIIETMCNRYGMPVKDGRDFPAPQALAALSEDALRDCGAGYRARYIIEAARMVCDGFDLAALAGMPYLAAKRALAEIPGVGPKVADCIALYALGFMQAFPADVWMRRVLENVYGYRGKNDAELMEFVQRRFGANAGIAQQYLFHYARNNRHVCS